MVNDTFMEFNPLAPDSNPSQTYLSTSLVRSIKEEANMRPYSKEIDLLLLICKHFLGLAGQTELDLVDSFVFQTNLVSNVDFEVLYFFFLLRLNQNMRNFRTKLKFEHQFLWELCLRTAFPLEETESINVKVHLGARLMLIKGPRAH